ncbi:hypothetical protein EON67_02675 [archaeon]|nr:MAG: hypothetical protein EON67_02675 [archaeon]
MPKAKYADRGKPKPKSVKARAPLNSKRKLSRHGKKVKAGLAGAAVQYMTRTRAVRKLQISLRDFRCVPTLARAATLSSRSHAVCDVRAALLMHTRAHARPSTCARARARLSEYVLAVGCAF